MKKKSILVTGSSGVIGTRLCQRLLQEGFLVIGADIRPNKWDHQIDKLTTIVDLRDSTSTNNLPAQPDFIVHLAAHARVYDLINNPRLAQENLEIMFNLLEYARSMQNPKILFASSREVYGNTKKTLHSENAVDISYCESPYTVSKIAGEAWLHAYRRCFSVNSVIFRFSNVYGMYDEHDRVVPVFIRQMARNKDVIIFGKEKKLDFCHVDDVVTGIISGINRFDSIKNTVLNIASGKGTSLIHVAQMIKKIMNSESSIIVKHKRVGEMIAFTADIKRAKKLLKFKPQISIQTGLTQTVAWYKKNIVL